MKIENHKFSGRHISFQKSPNYGETFTEGLPDTIVIHYTAGGSLSSSVRTLSNPNSKASAHLVVGKDGKIVQLVPFDTIAWHAGKSSHLQRNGLNKYSIGIEIDNAGRLVKSGKGYSSWFGRIYSDEEVIEAVHRNERSPTYWHRYSEEQITVVQEICSLLIDSYNITHLLGHEEISPGRKTDPGPAFPLDKIQERLLMQEQNKETGHSISSSIGKTGLVSVGKLNIRSDPAMSAATIADPLPRGTIVNIVDESDGWYKVELTTKGWIRNEYVKT